MRIKDVVIERAKTSRLVSSILDGVVTRKEMRIWRSQAFAPPSPSHVKRECLRRNGLSNGTWVETGTYLGITTEFLGQNFPRVISIEPDPELFRRASARLSKYANIEVLNTTSEIGFSGALGRLQGDVNFWLDGHFSGGSTFEGNQVTPILNELGEIVTHLPQFDAVVVMIDDVRLFTDEGGPDSDGYPDKSVLIEWAETNRLSWSFEHDIFVARSR